MAQKSVILYGLVLISVLLACREVVSATELSEANVSERKTTIPIERPELNSDKLFGGFPRGGRYGDRFSYGFGGFRKPRFGRGFRGHYRPGFPGGIGPVYGGGGLGQPLFGGGYGRPGFFGPGI